MRVHQYAPAFDPTRAGTDTQAPAYPTPSAPAPDLIQRARAAPGSLSADDVLQLQRTLGNRAVNRLLVQAKLVVTPAGDRYEQEADRVARQVAQRAVTVQRGVTAAGGLSVDAGVEGAIQNARHGGQALPDSLRGSLEQSFGADFGGVKVHTDARADGLNRSLSARAFTTGRDIFFRQGEYHPGSSGGRQLIAHELTHVVQQTGPGVQRKPGPADGPAPNALQRLIYKDEDAKAKKKPYKDITRTLWYKGFEDVERQKAAHALQDDLEEHLTTEEASARIESAVQGKAKKRKPQKQQPKSEKEIEVHAPPPVIKPGKEEVEEPKKRVKKQESETPAKRRSLRGKTVLPPLAPFVGEEGGRPWLWVAAPLIKISKSKKVISVPAHSVHSKDVAQIGQVFWGSYTIVTREKPIFSKNVKKWTPTQDEHTEPQYFTWVQEHLKSELAEYEGEVLAVILEVNQTNTPCSGKECRPKILKEWITPSKSGPLYIARMSAYQIYESQPPKVNLTTDKAKELRKRGTTVPTVTKPSVIHSVPIK